MEQMVEPDRTIMIVSVIGLVVIWGSVAYHKFVQGGGPPRLGEEQADQAPEGPEPPPSGGDQGRGRKRSRRR